LRTHRAAGLCANKYGHNGNGNEYWTVSTYKPGKRIVVRSEREDNPISYVLGKTAHYVNKAGRKIDQQLIMPGSRIIVYTSRGQMHAAKRVVLDED
jgi:hypothetical protein